MNPAAPAPLLSAALTLLLAPGPLTSARDADASRWWRGLAPPREHADARGIVALRPPLEGRVRVLGATFRMGSTPQEMVAALSLCRREVLAPTCEDDRFANLIRAEGHAHDVTVFTFDLDRTEVPMRAYARCVEAGVCAPPGFAPGDPRFDRPALPVVDIRWDDAAAYCAWLGGRLPTEGEWELAARGIERREFPWGTVYSPRLCNHGAFAPDPADAVDGYVDLAPIGSFSDGATPSGLLDMAGNAGEWIADLWDTDENNFGYPSAPQVNPKGPATGAWHVVRGGSFLDGATRVRAAARSYTILARSPAIGFRCAYEPR
jgi:formylglycine-generating enzyme